VNQLPLITYTNGLSIPLATDSQITGYALSADQLKVTFMEPPSISFEIDGSKGTLMFSKGTYLDFQANDAVGRTRELRLGYNGYGNARLVISGGDEFSRVVLVYSDGVRIRLTYVTGPSETSTATLYSENPSFLYRLGDLSPTNQYDLPGVTNGYLINQVGMIRPLEWNMIDAGIDYDRGTVGAEIAYSVGTEKLGIKNLIMNEPSKGGADLITTDETVVVQARLIDMRKVQLNQEQIVINQELIDMVEQLQYDFQKHPLAHTGYVVFSYVDYDNSIKTIILEVLRT
jgi:hypothetical protein